MFSIRIKWINITTSRAIILAFRVLQRDVLAFNEETSARNSAFVILDATIDSLDVIANKTVQQKVGRNAKFLYKVDLKRVLAMPLSENAIQIFAFLANLGCRCPKLEMETAGTSHCNRVSKNTFSLLHLTWQDGAVISRYLESKFNWIWHQNTL